MRYILSLSTLCLLLAGCVENSDIDRQLANAELLIKSAPDSSLLILSKVNIAGASHNFENRRAKLSMLSAKAKVRTGKTFLTDENFENAITYYEAQKDTIALLDMYQLAAIKMRWLGHQDSSVIFINKAIDIASTSTNPTKSELFIELSNLYAKPALTKDYRKAIAYAKQALTTASRVEEKARAQHDIGLFYSFCDQNDSAAEYIDKALNSVSHNSPHYTTYALNYANIPSADFSKSMTYLNNIKEQSLGKLMTLGFIYLNHNIPDSAKHFLAISKRIYNENPSQYSINTFNNLRILEQSVGLLDHDVIIPSEGTVTNDSISEVTAIQRKISDERHEYNNQLQLRLLQSKAHRQQLFSIGLGALLVLSVVFVLYVWYSKHKFLKLKQRLDSIRIEQIVTEANDDASKPTGFLDLAHRRMNICKEQFRITKLQSEIDQMEMQYRSTGKFSSINSREKVQKELIGCFADTIVDLKMTGAKLNLDDIITCIMSCLNESNAAIAACLGSTDTAVRTRKSRLRTKLPPHFLEMFDLQSN